MSKITSVWEKLPKHDYTPFGGYRDHLLKLGKMGPAVSIGDTRFAIIQFEREILKIVLYDDRSRLWSDLFTLAEPCYYVNWQDEISLAFGKHLYLFCYRKRVMYIMNITKHVVLRTSVGNGFGDSFRYRYARIIVFNGELCMVAATEDDHCLIYRAWNRTNYDFDDAIILSRTLSLKDFALHTDANCIWVIGGKIPIPGAYPSVSAASVTYKNTSSIHQFIKNKDHGFTHNAYHGVLPCPMSKVTIGSYCKFNQFLICGSHIGIWQTARSLDIIEVIPQGNNIPSCNKLQCALPVAHNCSAVVLCNAIADTKTVSGYIRRICTNTNFPPAYLLHYICQYYVNAYLHIIDRCSGNHYRCALD